MAKEKKQKEEADREAGIMEEDEEDKIIEEDIKEIEREIGKEKIEDEEERGEMQSGETPDTPKTEVKEETDDTKRILFVIGILVACFVLFIAVRYFTQERALTIDDLHQMNLEGKETENNYMYNGFSVVRVGDLWYTQVQRDNKLFNIALHHGPRELENVSISGKINSTFNSGKLYISFNPKGKNTEWTALAAAALSSNLAKGIGVTPVAACDRNTTECADRPIITCNSGKPVIYLSQEKDAARILLKGNCVTLEGQKDELVRAVEKFLLVWYKVM